jgi:hypothetical protein
MEEPRCRSREERTAHLRKEEEMKWKVGIDGCSTSTNIEQVANILEVEMSKNSTGNAFLTR